MHSFCCTAWLALALAACGDARAGADWTGTVETLANGAVLVGNPERGVWRDGEEWRLVPELRLGIADGAGPELFGNISALEVDALGRIWVADDQAREIRVFEPDGRHVRSIGRRGGGPGEFQQIGGMGWGGDGHLWVFDPGNARFAVFDTAGAFVTSHRRVAGYRIPWPGGFDSQGRLYDLQGVVRPGEAMREVLKLDHVEG